MASDQLSPTEHRQHVEHDGHGGHGDHAARFRDRFWLSLVLTIPVVAYSEMVQEWLGFTPPQFPGSQWVAPVLGTVVFVYGGWPFLEGGLSEARARQPGMMLLISLAILVGFGASAASALGLFDLEFWWELALLIVIMLLGHWLEPWTPWPRCCPTRPSGSSATGSRPWPSVTWPSGTWCWSARAAGSRPTAGSSRATPSWTSR
jgi:cation transport ATPase